MQIGLSRNDLKVDNRLKAKGFPPFSKASPQQKREAMDFLIQTEREAMRDIAAGKSVPGYYKGKFWNKDEQGLF